jgi:ABC-type phosphate transport system permease subunit
LVIVHLNVAELDVIVTGVFGLLVFVIEADPETNDHDPVPYTGVLPASVVELPQIDWLGPALAVVGFLQTRIL